MRRILILPLVERNSRLTNGWRPQMVGLPEWDERKLPAPPAVWNWNKGADPFELWIFFFKRDAAGARKTAMETEPKRGADKQRADCASNGFFRARENPQP
jgi:hypothetical protein